MDELATLDREAFAQVWSRVDAQGAGPVEVVGPDVAPPPQETPEKDGTAQPPQGQILQTLVLACLSDASVYRDLDRRQRRGGPRLSGSQAGGPRSGSVQLTDLKNRKVRQAKRLAAAYFLLSGVRYWPQDATPVNPPESLFPALRERFLAEGRRAAELETLAQQATDPDLVELYTSLAQETREMTRTIRSIVEQET